MDIKVGDSVYWNGSCGIIMQVGRNSFSDRQVKIHWMNGAGNGLTTSWEYVVDAGRMRNKYLDLLTK